MDWQHTYDTRVRDRHQTFIDEAAARRLARNAAVITPRYREWLARRLVVLALLLAPSLHRSPRSMLGDGTSTSLPPHPPVIRGELPR